jgi:EAL domain-containing protein (putative c-di-GMP-specific phosphodiesterase class I)/GGDEF domain-containing protein
MFERLPDIWNGSISNFPLLMLQAAAVIGILSVMLTFTHHTQQLLRPFPLRCGLTIGVAGFLLVGMSFEIINLPSRPYISTDLLFLGGLFGGWLGGGVCWALVWSGRVLFGGTQGAGAAALDMALLGLAGAQMHHWLLRKDLAKLVVGDMLAVWGVKMVVSVGSVLLLGSTGLAPLARSVDLAYARAFSFGISFILIGCLLTLLRREARDRAAFAREIQLGLTDPLTGLPNRKALREHLDALLAASPEVPNTLLTLELANVWDMVRVHGHEWADQFWRELVPVLRDPRFPVPLARFDPRCYMFTDLTLVIVLRGIALDSVEGAGLAEQLQVELVDHLRTGEAHEQAPRLRIGVAECNAAAAQRAAPVLRNLNLALQGDTRPLRYFRHSFAEKAALDEELRILLIGWIRSSHAPMAYQPKCDLATGEVTGAEALLRARDGRGKPVSPPLLLEVAMRNQLFIELEWCTIETVVQAIGTAIAAGRPLCLAVNVSAASLTVPGFGERVVDLLRARQTPCELLSVEITENGQVPEVDTVEESVRALTAAGVRLSLDDFGTGYSALSMLARFPFNEVKVDHSMVARLDQSRMRAAVSLAFESARRYNATLCAEGVETEAQRLALQSLGIGQGQGYLFAPAIPLDRLLAVPTLWQPPARVASMAV